MKRVIRFQRTRYYFFALSACIFVAGAAGLIFNRGLNLGVDFKAGIALQFQVAPASFTLQYAGEDKAAISIPAGEQALTASGDLIVTIVSAKDGTSQDFPFRYTDYATVGVLAEALRKTPGIRVEVKGNPEASPSRLVPLTRPADITATAYTVNLMPEAGAGVQASMTDVRVVLSELGQFDLQAVGRPINQEFIARLAAKEEDTDFQTRTEARVMELLRGKYGADQVILKRTDFVGPRLSQSLASQSIWLVLIALLLIQVYMSFRFKMVYAVAAVLALVHDAAVMLVFAALFRVEVDAGSIAAILTILGYSINDTIVIFDRVRENQNLMRGSALEGMLDTSVTQTLGRTIITSGATMLAVLSLFILTSGSMKNFALFMIVGIIEGTYSTVFIASPIVLEWENLMDRRRKRREMEKYGIKAKHLEAEPVEIEEAGKVTAEADAAGEAPAAGEDVKTAIASPADSQASEGVSSTAGAQASPASLPDKQPSASQDKQGSRRHPKYRRRH